MISDSESDDDVVEILDLDDLPKTQEGSTTVTPLRPELRVPRVAKRRRLEMHREVMAGVQDMDHRMIQMERRMTELYEELRALKTCLQMILTQETPSVAGTWEGN